MNRKIVAIPVDLIDAGPRKRELDPDWAALIAETMRDRGQDTPIIVREASPDGRHLLVAGMHRLAALQIAGIGTADAFVFTGSDLEAELVEIDENLIRRELSELDRATFLAERQRIWQALYPATKPGGDRRSDQIRKSANLVQAALTERFSDATARKLGVSSDTIDRAIRRFRAIAEDVRKRLATTRIAQVGSELDALARFSHEQQRRIAAELLAAEAPAATVRQAAIRLRYVTVPAVNPVDDQFRRIWDLWGKTTEKRARAQFLRQLVASAAKADLAVLRAALATADGEEVEEAGEGLSSFKLDALQRIVAAHDAAGGGAAWVKKPGGIQQQTISALQISGLIEAEAGGKSIRPTVEGRRAARDDAEGAG